MTLASKKHLIVLLISSCGALTACSSNPVIPNANQEVVASALSLQNSFEETTLAHRKAGEIAIGSFEAKLRSKVRADLALDFEHLSSASKDELLAELNKIDQRLSLFQHASHRGTALEQLWALLPALPTLEIRKAFKVALKERFSESPELSHEKMAELMDLQLNRLFGDFAISLDALTPETEKFESLLVKKLQAEGLTISARRPSLIMEYFIDSYEEEGKVELVTDFEFKDRNAQTFQALSNEAAYSSSAGEQARDEAFKVIANDVAEQLLHKAITRIHAVNSVK